jgi:hypothetical protein
MSLGKEYLHQIHNALAAFEAAVGQRDKRWFGSKVALQQEVDITRQKVVDVIVEIVTQERMKPGR